MAISEALLKQIEEKTDMLGLVSAYVPLTQKGSQYWGLCPFHTEKTPSFSVSLERKAYYCFGCKKGGNAFSFLQEMEGMSFPEAAKELAKRAGIDIEDSNGFASKEAAQRRSLLELYQKTSKAFAYLLWNSEEGAKALRYAAERGLSEETIRRFSLGYVKNQSGWLFSFLKKKGYSEKFLEESGLFSRNNPQYCLFRGRLVFPISNASGEILGFSGRILPGADKNAPKYINSPETLVYRKKELVYGLYQAKPAIRQTKRFILCEGAMDACALSQMGFAEAVAPLGSALTQEQASLLKRYASSGLLLFDGDEAGQKAVMAAALICERLELDIKAAKLSGGKDPAELLQKKEDGGLLQKSLDSANVVFDFLLAAAAEKEASNGAAGIERICQSLFPYLSAVQSPIKREACFKVLALRLSISEEALKEEFFRKEQKERKPPAAVASGQKPAAPLFKERPVHDLFCAFLARPDLYLKFKKQINLDSFADEELKRVEFYLQEAGLAANLFTAAQNGILSGALKELFLKKAADYDDSYSWEARAESSLKRLKLEDLERKRQATTALIAKAEHEGKSKEAIDDLFKESLLIAQELAQLKIEAGDNV